MRPDPRRAPSRSQDRTLTLSLTIPPPLRTRREDDEDDDEECEACETVPEHVKKVASGKLWSSSQFPAGTTGVTNWEMSNLTAAQAWECPCLDRRTAPRPAPCLCLVPPRPCSSHFERTQMPSHELGIAAWCVVARAVVHAVSPEAPLSGAHSFLTTASLPGRL